MSRIDYTSLLRLSGRARDLKIKEPGLSLFPGRFTELPTSPDYQGLCPVHVEKTPSFYLKVRWNAYHCFGCGIKGSPIGLALDIPRGDAGLAYLEERLRFSRRNPDELAVIMWQAIFGTGERIEDYAKRSWVGIEFGPSIEKLREIYHEIISKRRRK